ncbi:uncharacterized protein LOC107326682 [Python bivittatus]|uniref:Uncharacterized protein LOC107326682 n=1 Tax=Python bivittatus TaxID=176946 RepID=A0A9F3W1W6_PYTBI|nr:uncharacterized protein LOC107326682 [Python bivittatus]
MQPLVGLFCFSWLLATGSCLECESCTAFNEDCTGKLELCSEDQDTCATIVTETIMGKRTSFGIVKSCYQSSKCLGSNTQYPFLKVNVNIECSSSQVGKMEIEGGEALADRKKSLFEKLLQVKDLMNKDSSAISENLRIMARESRAVTGEPMVVTGKPPVGTGKPPVDWKAPGYDWKAHDWKAPGYNYKTHNYPIGSNNYR